MFIDSNEVINLPVPVMGRMQKNCENGLKLNDYCNMLTVL